jgi:hypothetical protein
MPCRWWFALLFPLLVTPAWADKVTLEEPVDDDRVFGVGLRLDVHGQVQTRGEDNKTVPLPMTASAAISYRERRLLGLGSQAETLRAVREYEQAQVDIEVAEEKSTISLPNALKLAVAQGRSSGAEVYSLGGVLTAQELELLSPPCDSLALTALLPISPVEPGDTWTPAAWVGQYLARLEATTKSEVTCKFDKLDGDIARLSFQATVSGAVQGTLSEVAITGTLDFHLKDRCITAADVKQTEKRAIGAVSVGLDVTARTRLLRKPAQLPGRVGEATVVQAASQDPPESALLLRFESPWNLSLLHPRGWHLFQQTEQVAIFRLLDDGLFVAQANLSPIPSAEPGGHTSETVFQNDIRQSLGARLKVLGEGETIPTGDGRYLYRVIAEGAIGERQLTWIYYLCADLSGRQASLLIAVDTALREKLADRDKELALSLRFGPPKAAAVLPGARPTAK